KVVVSLRGQPRAWLVHVPTLPPDRQVEAVAQKLRDLNPDFDGKVGSRIDGGKVVEVHLFTDHVTDVTPLKALSALEIWVVRGSGSAKGELADIAPVRSLSKLVYLDFSCNKVKDLSALRGMALRTLSCWANPVEDLRPLLGMPLTKLDLNHSYAKD